MPDKLLEFEVVPATEIEDVELLRPVLEETVRNPFSGEIFHDEIEEILIDVEAYRNGAEDRYYAVAVSAGGLMLGMMGLKPPEPMMEALKTGTNPIELKHAAVSRNARRTGVGTALADHLEDYATEKGHDELLLNSGPRYRLSGWPFWRSRYGEEFATLEKFYAGKYDALVWRTSLPRQK